MVISIYEIPGMNNFAALLMPSLIGLFAGISHGLISHQLDLPMSLPEQVVQSFSSQT